MGFDLYPWVQVIYTKRQGSLLISGNLLQDLGFIGKFANSRLVRVYVIPLRFCGVRLYYPVTEQVLEESGLREDSCGICSREGRYELQTA